MAENISFSRAESFNKDRIESFYEQAKSVLDKLNIDSYPQLFYNCDEMGLSSVPNNSQRVIANKGAKLVQRVHVLERGVLTTLLPCCNAIEELIPPLLIFKRNAIPSLDNYPEGTKSLLSFLKIFKNITKKLMVKKVSYF